MEHREEITDEIGAVQASKEMLAKIRKVLELSRRAGTEGEAAAAAHRLQELMTKYNLEIADLEVRTGRAVQQVGEANYDLEKSGFKWKLDLAEYIADYFYCAPIVDRRAKTVVFIGRPDNVESLRMLYRWLIEQIRQLATTERRAHVAQTGEHIDPLRWQLGFGEGAARRLNERMAELRTSQTESSTALVLHHQSEISDYTEQKYGFRRDGKRTKREQEWADNYARQQREREDLLYECQRNHNMEPYYTKYPWLRPLTPEQQAAKDKADREYDQRQRRNAARRRDNRRSHIYKEETDEEREARYQKRTAKASGVKNADRINLQPFIEGSVDNKKKVKG